MTQAATFDELIHAPKRLRICALLAATTAVEFATLRDALDVSDSVLSKHLSALESAHYITTQREVRAARARLWVSLSPAGQRAYAAHVRALHEIVMLSEAMPWPGTAGAVDAMKAGTDGISAGSGDGPAAE